MTGGDPSVDPVQLARDVHALGPRIVVVTGGHRAQPIDLYDDGERVVEIAGERYDSDASHGSGCTHSSVLAARLAHGDDPLSAARTAKAAAAGAVRDGLRQIGHGPGPVNILGGFGLDRGAVSGRRAGTSADLAAGPRDLSVT